MKLLLDTHIFLWSLLEPEKLASETVDLLDDPDIEKYLSAASSWEIAIKYAKGFLQLPKPPKHFVTEHVIAAEIMALPITLNDTLAVADLPPIHRDPFDRILITQAIQNDMFIVTDDRVFAEYEVRLIDI